jgi:hypothetical protein
MGARFEIVKNDLWVLWEKLFNGNWAEIVIPTIASPNGQFIGCLVPIENFSTSEVYRLGKMFAEDPQNEIAIFSKPFGNRNKLCLSILFRYVSYLTQEEMDHAAECLQRQIHSAFGIPALVVRKINLLDAENRLT